MAKKKKKARKAKKAATKTPKKKAATKTSRKAPKTPAKKTAKKKTAPKTAARKAAGKPSFVPAKSASTPMLPGMAEGIEAEEFEPEVGLVVDDEEDEDVDFPEADDIVATPDLEKLPDDDEGEW